MKNHHKNLNEQEDAYVTTFLNSTLCLIFKYAQIVYINKQKKKQKTLQFSGTEVNHKIGRQDMNTDWSDC